MKTIGARNTASRNCIIVLSLTSLICLSLSHAQTTAGNVDWSSASDLQVMLQAIESVPPAPAITAPRRGTFYSAQHAPGTRLAWPPLPGNINGLPVWNLGDGVYLLDDLQENYALPLMSSSMAGGISPPGGGGGGGTNNYEYTFTPPVYTTNDLWLEMTAMTNMTAFLTIHPPWNVTNGVWDLYYTTNLSPPETWSWLLRSFAGQTNLTVNNATDAQGFYRLGPLNDPIGNDSLGTNFWVGFYSMDDYAGPYEAYVTPTLSLYISSPVGASGTVIIQEGPGTLILGPGITNTFTVAAGAVTNMSILAAAMMTGNLCKSPETWLLN